MNIDWIPIFVGTFIAALSGYLAIRFMMEIISKTSLKYFAVYVFLLGGFVLMDQYFFRVIF